MDNKIQTDQEILDLKKEIKENRKGLYKLLDSMEECTTNINDFIPETKDYRTKFGAMSQAQEKVKVISEIIKTNLEIRKSIEASIKNEKELLNNYNDKYDINKESELTLDDVVKQIEEYEESKTNNIVHLQ